MIESGYKIFVYCNEHPYKEAVTNFIFDGRAWVERKTRKDHRPSRRKGTELRIVSAKGPDGEIASSEIRSKRDWDGYRLVCSRCRRRKPAQRRNHAYRPKTLHSALFEVAKRGQTELTLLELDAIVKEQADATSSEPDR